MKVNNKLGKLIGRVSGHNSFHRQRWCVTRGGFYTGLLLLVLVLCVYGSPRVAWADDPAQETPEPPVASEEVESKRPDIAAVVYAAALQMRGSSVDTSPVSFSAAAQQALREESHIYRGFGRPLYSVLRFVQSAGQENVYDLGVAMFFVDAGLRRSAVYGELTYTLGETQIAVQSARLSPIVPDRPQTVLSIVPADRVPNDLLQTYPTHAELLPWVVANALSAGEQATVPSGKKPYYIFAASLDRWAEGAKLEIRISDDANGMDGEAGGCMDTDYEGWHVAALPGQFALNTTPEFFIKMIYTPGIDVKPGKREPRLLGVYSSYLHAVEGGEPEDTDQDQFSLPDVEIDFELPGVDIDIGEDKITITIDGDEDGGTQIEIERPQWCIAEAAYGSQTAEELDVLRDFRDDVLAQTTAGRELVEMYYDVSPPVAGFISRHEIWRTLVRELVIDPAVAAIDASSNLWQD